MMSPVLCVACVPSQVVVVVPRHVAWARGDVVVMVIRGERFIIFYVETLVYQKTNQRNTRP